MIRLMAMAAAVSLTFGAGAALADTLKLHDETGAAVEVDTSKMSGCTMVFDSAGTAFQICRLEKVQLVPAGSTRMRPGQTKVRPRAEVVYAKTE